MDPYEILGIRPNAGRDEIELSYKGRRSQYHPDRYAQSDALTQAWATGKMQELNEAYAVLKDPEARARFDSVKARQASRPQSPPPPTPRGTLRDALQGLRFKADPFERVFVAPHIPLKKLHGAVESYGDGLRPHDVIVLIDDTLFGSAREGVLITETKIFCKASFESVDQRLLGCLSDIRAQGRFVYIHGERYAELRMPDYRDLAMLFEAVNRYLQDNNC